MLLCVEINTQIVAITTSLIKALKANPFLCRFYFDVAIGGKNQRKLKRKSGGGLNKGLLD